jgi:GT2 family glycosyltransferase
MKLSVVLGTYNRLDQLQRCVESIIKETATPYTVYITDAGSTDGTIEYLESIASETVIPIFVGEKLGQARAYNDVFMRIDTKYVCWLSDDNEVVNNGLDRAVSILVSDDQIGMVALKTRDKQGPFVGAPYIGGISAAGILNVNQGVLPTAVLKEVGGFSEEFRDYGIDPALTAEVLFAGYKIVYTSKVALYHYRNWSEDPSSENYQWLQQRHAVAKELYLQRYCSQATVYPNYAYRLKAKFAHNLKKVMQRLLPGRLLRQSAAVRTCFIVLSARYISVFDPVLSLGKGYHLVQKLNATGCRLR